ncbi:MAG: glutathione S-transferase family protein [Pseudomonadota bacterium]
MRYTIVIGNKNYSSWSLRPWLVLDHFGFEYEEELVALDLEDTRSRLLAFSPAAKVPILIDRSYAVWDSLAIIEYLAEVNPDAGIWPSDMQERARARTLSAEMHAGFPGLRKACPMNLKKSFKFRPRGGPAAVKDVERFEQIVRDRMMRSGGPFLFGEWGAVDAMYTPLATRLATYNWPMNDETRAYVDALLATPSFLKWREAALEEKWVIAADEVK